jgi:hypothetical protein
MVFVNWQIIADSLNVTETETNVNKNETGLLQAV